MGVTRRETARNWCFLFLARSFSCRVSPYCYQNLFSSSGRALPFDPHNYGIRVLAPSIGTRPRKEPAKDVSEITRPFLFSSRHESAPANLIKTMSIQSFFFESTASHR